MSTTQAQDANGVANRSANSTTESEAGNPAADECPEWAIKKLKSHNNSNTVGWEEFLVEGECPECGSNRLVQAIQTAGAVQCVSCPACDHIIEEP